MGDADVLASQADQDLLLLKIKNSRLIIYNQTGHAVHWEQPLRFATELRNFMNKQL
jgi:pimeloyl-ACP methyl ester carboxylesterase